MQIGPDGASLWTVSGHDSFAAMLDTTTNTLVDDIVVGRAPAQVARDIETGEGAHGIVVDPSGRHTYVTNLYGSDVAVLDLDTLAVVARIPVGDKPNGISFSTVTVERQPTTMLRLADASEAPGGALGRRRT